MSFTKNLWAATAGLQTQIQTMPFNAELAAGTLPVDTFQTYIIQDAHYLEGFARALALAAARAPDPGTIAQLASSANGAVAVERQLHSQYMALYGITPQMFTDTQPSQACDHYVSFLLRSAALDPFPVAVASLLPCFWVYFEVGHLIHKKASDDHPFKDWVDTYASDAFGASVKAMLALIDRLAEETDPIMRAQMQAAFAASSWHEWNFWNSAYHGTTWAAPARPADRR